MKLSRSLRQVLWVLAAATFVVTLFLGSRGDGGPRTDAERVDSLAHAFACPECAGQSVAQSNAPAAQNIRTAIAQFVDEGRTDGEIAALLQDRFGERVLLNPQSDGATGLVWVVPVVVGVVALAGLVLVFLRWRRPLGGAVSDADRELVSEFLAERAEIAELL